MQKKRENFSSKFGVLAAAAGSAIGLGNIWKFPYITGQNGGAAFLVVYLFFIAFIGIPVMMSEFIIGRKAQQNVFGAFKSLTKQGFWRIIAVFGVLAAFLILSFYSTVAGWTMEYIYLAVMNKFTGQTPETLSVIFSDFSSSYYKPVFYQILFMLFTALIVLGGVKKGIEKSAKIMMPLLVLIILYLDITALTLKGSAQGLHFLFYPDFSKVTPRCFIDALGHSFFTLSLGMGVLITYASYFNKQINLTLVSVQVAVSDTVIALLAGIAIFAVVFAFGAEPASGPGLVFMTLPNIFSQIPGGYLFAILFFVLLFLAAITSSISILEVVVAYLSEERKMSRTKATWLAALAITITGILCTLSFGPLANVKLFGKTFFDIFDFTASNILLPLGGMLIALFVGWVLPKHVVIDELSNFSAHKVRFLKLFLFLVRFVAPLAIMFVFLHGLGLFNI